MSDLAGLLENAATATRTAEAAEDYLAHPPTDGRYGVNITWTWGNNGNSDGYLAIKRMVTEQIEQMLPSLIDAAVAALKTKAFTARQKAAKALEE